MKDMNSKKTIVSLLLAMSLTVFLPQCGSSGGSDGGGGLGGVFIGVGAEATVILSDNGGDSWTKHKLGASDASATTLLNSIAYGDNTLIAVGIKGIGSANPSSAIFTSSDAGETWMERTSSGPDVELRSIAYGGGTFVAVGNPNSGSSTILTSSDAGETWTHQTSSLGGLTDSLWSVASKDNIFVAVGERNSIGVSTDGGETWTKQTAPTSLDANNGLQYIIYGNDPNATLAAMGGGSGNLPPSLITSHDGGETWTDQITDTTGFDPGSPLSSMTYASGTFVGVGFNSLIYTSRNGMDWTRGVASEADRDFYSIAYGRNRFFTLAGSSVYKSIGGTSWEIQPIKPDGLLSNTETILSLVFFD